MLLARTAPRPAFNPHLPCVYMNSPPLESTSGLNVSHHALAHLQLGLVTRTHCQEAVKPCAAWLAGTSEPPRAGLQPLTSSRAATPHKRLLHLSPKERKWLYTVFPPWSVKRDNSSPVCLSGNVLDFWSPQFGIPRSIHFTAMLGLPTLIYMLLNLISSESPHNSHLCTWC